jgi:heme exporter protein B
VTGFWRLLRRELALSWGKGGGPLLALAFYAAIATLLPLAIGSEPARLAAIAPGSAWIGLALASLLSLERLFERDYEDGALDLLALGPAPLELAAVAKCLAQWITTGAPLALLSPIAAISLGADAHIAPVTLLAALIGGLGFSFCGGIGAALSLGSRRGGMLIAVVVLPMFAPPVIFGAGAITAYAAGMDWKTALLLLSAYSLAVAALGPFAMAAACRNALS